MLEPAAIHAHLAAGAGRRDVFRGRRALVTAGPTHEAVDPVRFLGNRSSGKMGFAVAAALAAQQADVVLVSGPVALETPAGVARVDVETALQMHDAVMAALPGVDLFVAAAAVADYRPACAADRKIKKSTAGMTLELVRNPDILGDVAARPQRPFCVGFAAETDDVESHAEAKRRRKGIDMIAANRVGAGLAFGRDDNALAVLWDGGREYLPNQSKTTLAQRLVELIGERMGA
jgi:phosphopantothenoylcysteine decarboxylase/phosphopantothenate--cysteine ligase